MIVQLLCRKRSNDAVNLTVHRKTTTCNHASSLGQQILVLKNSLTEFENADCLLSGHRLADILIDWSSRIGRVQLAIQVAQHLHNHLSAPVPLHLNRNHAS